MDRATYDRMRVLQEGHWWFKGRRAILSGLIEDLQLPKDARILEAGCGPGGNLGMLSALAMLMLVVVYAVFFVMQRLGMRMTRSELG